MNNHYIINGIDIRSVSQPERAPCDESTLHRIEENADRQASESLRVRERNDNNRPTPNHVHLSDIRSRRDETIDRFLR